MHFHAEAGLERRWGARIAALLVLATPPAAHAGNAAHAVTPDSILRAVRAGAPPPVPAVLTLRDAVAISLSSNPGLAGTALDVTASQARARDAGRPPNPSLEIEAKNWGGALGAGRLETTVALGQPVELGGDRGARVAEAESGIALARAGLELRARELAETVAADFVAAWTAQERLWLLRESRRLARDAVASAIERFAAGAASEVERIRAEGRLALVESEIHRAESGAVEARRALALRWGAADATFDSLLLPPPDRAPAPAVEVLIARLDRHPEVLRAAAGARGAEARARAIRAARVPDLEMRVGVRDLREAGGTGFVAALSLPLPVWNGQSGALLAAEADRERAALEARAVGLRLESETRSAAGRLEASILALERLESGAAPAADAALAALRDAYRSGRLGYVDLVEGERAAIEARLATVEAASDVWRARAALERLAGPLAPEANQEVER